MKFWEAMKALEEGKKVRCRGWESNQAIFKLNDCIAKLNDTTQNWHLYHGDEWELYEEPQKKCVDNKALLKKKVSELCQLLEAVVDEVIK